MVELQTYKGYYLWLYVPSLAASSIFILAFVAVTAAHFWHIFKTHSWFCLAFAIGVEVIGYIARSVAHNETGKLMPFVIQNAFILLAPALFAASIYMTLGHIIRCVKGESYSTIRVNWLTKTFVLGDVLSFLIQGSASGLIVTGNNLRLGEDIVVVGLFIQVIMFGLFAITAIIFVVWYPSGMRSTALNVASMELTTQYRRR